MSEGRDALFHEMVNSAGWDELVRLARAAVDSDLHALREARQMTNEQRQVHLAHIDAIEGLLAKCYSRAGSEVPQSVKAQFH